MATGVKHALHDLQAGQLWKIEHGYVYIVTQGKRLIRYQMLREATRPASAATQMILIEALLNFLKHSEAELVSRNLAIAA